MHSISFLTIKSSGEGFIKERGSKFISLAMPIESEEEVKKKLAEARKKYYNASHYCYAYIIGADYTRYRAFDDGEPNHSAGDPILGQIKAKGLTNVLIIVIRYFGGVKLGVGGLVQAYKAAAEDALAKTVIIEKEVTEKFLLTFDYQSNAEAMKLVKEFGLEIINQQYSDSCSLTVSIQIRNQAAFLTKLKLLNNLGIPIQLTEQA